MVAQCGMLGLTFTRFSPSAPQKQEELAVYFICLCALKRSVCGGQVFIVEGGSLGLNSGYLAASTLATDPSCQPLLSRIRILFSVALFLFGGSVRYVVLLFCLFFCLFVLDMEFTVLLRLTSHVGGMVL